MSLLNCVNRIGAVSAQFVNGFLVGPPPHVMALLLVTASMMTTGAFCTARLPRDTSGALVDDEKEEAINMT